MADYTYKQLGIPLDLENWEALNDNFATISRDLNNLSGDVLASVIDGAKLIWKEPIDTFVDLATTYPDAQEGWTSMARDTGIVYRFNGTAWLEIQEIDATAVNEVDSRLTSQLAETAKALNAASFRTRFAETENDIDLLNVKVTGEETIWDTEQNMPVSPYGNNEYVHPDIIYFPQRWNGFRYWMVVNPYKNSLENTENPCIYVSNDSYVWQTPPGVTNPLYPYPGSPLHYSDPCWILDKNGHTLHLIHRSSGAGADNIYYMMSSDDGVNWTPQVEIFRIAGREILSPAVVWSGKKYYMYYIDATNAYALNRVESDDLLSWTNEITCVITGTTKKLWHIDIVDYGGGLVLAANEVGNDRLMLFKSRGFSEFTLSSQDFLLRAQVGGRALYKPDILLYKDSGNLNLMVHYSLNGVRDDPAVNWEMKRIVVPLGTSKTQVKTSPPIKLNYLNSGATAVEGDVPTTAINAYHINDKGLTHLSFRIDVGDLTAVPDTRLITISLPVPVSVYQTFHTFAIDHFGNSATAHSLYGVLDASLGRIYIKKLRTSPTASTVFRKEDLVGITSLRGSLTYFNNR